MEGDSWAYNWKINCKQKRGGLMSTVRKKKKTNCGRRYKWREECERKQVDEDARTHTHDDTKEWEDKTENGKGDKRGGIKTGRGMRQIKKKKMWVAHEFARDINMCTSLGSATITNSSCSLALISNLPACEIAKDGPRTA